MTKSNVSEIKKKEKKKNKALLIKIHSAEEVKVRSNGLWMIYGEDSSVENTYNHHNLF